MAYVKNSRNMLHKKVILTSRKESMRGYFEAGSEVTITGVDPYRGYSFTDSEGNSIIEAGWTGFEEIE